MPAFDVTIEEKGGRYGASPLEGAADVLSQYFGKRIGYVADPWSQLAEGFLVKMHATKPNCHFALTAADYGVDISKYGDAADYMKAGRIDLLEASVRSATESIATQWRELPKKWGVHLHWGLFVPLNAWERFDADARGLQTKWAEALGDWIDNYSAYRERAELRLRIMAEQAWRNAQQLGAETIMTRDDWRDMAKWIDGVAWRAMQDYPQRSQIRDLYELEYDQSFIPMPSLTEAQASWVEQVQADKAAKLELAKKQLEIDKTVKEAEYMEAWTKLSAAEQRARERRKLVAEYAKKMRADLEQKKAEALRVFYAGYSLQLRQRLYASISLVVEAVRAGEMSKKGERKIPAPASISLRTTIAELENLRLDNDEEITAMLETCKRLLGEPQSGDFTAAKVGQAIENMGVVLQTSILALGGVPKGPRRLKAEIDVLSELPSERESFLAEVRKRRQAIGEFESLGEAMIAGERLSPADLRGRRTRFKTED
jgi:hypothetical protein